MDDCCLKGFKWNGTPTGREEEYANLNTYVAGTNSDVAILFIADLFGWTYPNNRLLADHYAKEANATVYLPDFFGGEVLNFTHIEKTQWAKLDLPGWHTRNNKPARRPEIFHFAQTLRSQYRKTGAVGFCFGGWAVFQLGAAGNNLVDCISTTHPTWLEKAEIEAVGVPVQVMAPEFDTQFTQELRNACNNVIPTKGVPYEYRYFPKVVHGFATRGDENVEMERESMVRCKDAVVHWFVEFLHGE